MIGKAQKPRCFKNVKFLPCQCQYIKKSWMDGVLFEDCMQELQRKFSSERSLAQVTDNCLSHSHIENLKLIKLFFLPPYNTSTTQSMNQGVIRLLKANYGKNMVQKIIRSLEKNNALPKVSILKAM